MSVSCDVCMIEVDESTSSVNLDTGYDDANCASMLSTKFTIPQPRIDLISRPHLLNKLTNSFTRGHTLTLVCAPAGFGKTTLLSDWAAHSASTTYQLSNKAKDNEIINPKARLAWVSLDEGDNNIVRFWSAIITALQKIETNIGAGTLAALKSSQPPNIKTILTVLINDITNSIQHSNAFMTESPAVLIIDDYHFIQRDEIHKGLAFFISHLPHPNYGMNIVISTRVEPPILLHQLRARAQITEIRTNDLRFSYEETAAFFDRVMGFQLQPDQIAAMEIRTEGWIAGLQLAAVTMQAMLLQESVMTTSKEFSDFITAFTGSSRYVLDYLGEEIFSRQPDMVKQFLLKTSILHKLTGSLCDSVLDTSGSDNMLQLLEKSNLFIVSLDQNRIWYRYHRLFVEFLRTRLIQSSRSLLNTANHTSISELYYQASRWCESHGMLVEAVQYSLEGKHFTESARLIENIARTLLMQGEARMLLEWIEALPMQLVESRPRLYLVWLWALVTTGELDVAQPHLNILVSSEYGDELGYDGEIAAIQGFIHILMGNVNGGIAFAQKAMKHLNEDDVFLRGLVALNMGRAYDILGEISSASLVYEEAHRLGQTLDNDLVSLVALSQLGDVKLLQGCLYEATDIYFKALKLAKQPTGQQPLAGLAYAGLGIVYYERNELDTAEKYLHEGVRLGQQWENTDVFIYCMVHLAWVKYAQEKTAVVKTLMGAINDALEGQIVSQPTISFALAHLARLGMRLGDLSVGQHWLATYERDIKATPHDLAHTQLVTWAQILLSTGQSSDVIQKLVSAIDMLRTRGLVHYEIELMVLLSTAYQIEGMASLASETMESARNIGSKQGYKRVYFDNTLDIYASYNQEYDKVDNESSARRSMAEVSQPLRVLEERNVGNLLTYSDGKHFPILLDPLSRREQEVLLLLSSGLSNKDIARSLYIAVGTVKQHLKNIYSKFDVHNRTEAVHHAQALGII